MPEPPGDPGPRALRTRLVLPVAVLLSVIAIGTGGFAALWGADAVAWFDALYMTVITVTTVGYLEVRPLGTAGRLLAMAIAFTGVGALFYTLGVVMDHLVAARLTGLRGRLRMERRIQALERHVIVAGLGRVGRQAAGELHEARAPFVVIDPGEAAARLVEGRGWLAVAGDATEDAVLERAGVRRARGLIVTTSDDATNLYIVLSARVLNPGLTIVSRAVDEASVAKLVRAGANRAISPYAIGGHRLAHLLLSPGVVDFFETALRRGNEALAIEDLAVTGGSAAVGRALAELDLRARTGASVLAVVRDGTPLVNPAGDLQLQAGDQLLVLGTAQQLARVEGLVTGERA